MAAPVTHTAVMISVWKSLQRVNGMQAAADRTFENTQIWNAHAQVDVLCD